MLKKDVEVIIEGNCYNKIKDKMMEDHKMLFNDHCTLDNSGVELNNNNIFDSIKFIVKNKKLKLSNSNRCIIICENKRDYEGLNNDERIVLLNSSEFIVKSKQVISVMNKVSNPLDALLFIFFEML